MRIILISLPLLKTAVFLRTLKLYTNRSKIAEPEHLIAEDLYDDDELDI